MRILLAHQGPADVPPVAVVADHRWPRPTEVRVVTVIDPSTGALPTFPRVGELVDRWAWLRTQASAELDAVVERLAASGLDVDGSLGIGDPRTVLVEAARRWRADLLVVGTWIGAYDDGPRDTLAADLVRSAPCPVLVARRPSIDGLLLCTDGSDAALVAERFVASSPAFAAQPITVLNVVETHHPAAVLLPAIGAVDPEKVVDERHRGLAVATDAARRLASPDRAVRVRLASGPIGEQVDAAAIDTGADVVVLGSDDRRGWSRLLLGGVAAEVLAATDASVLVVRGGLGGLRPIQPRSRACRGPTTRRTAVPS